MLKFWIGLFSISCACIACADEDANSRLVEHLSRVEGDERYACAMVFSNSVLLASENTLVDQEWITLRVRCSASKLDYYCCGALEVDLGSDESISQSRRMWQQSIVVDGKEMHTFGFGENAETDSKFTRYGAQGQVYRRLDPYVVSMWNVLTAQTGASIEYVTDMMLNAQLLRSEVLPNGDVIGRWTDLPNKATTFEFRFAKDNDFAPVEAKFRVFDGKIGDGGQMMSEVFTEWGRLSDRTSVPKETTYKRRLANGDTVNGKVKFFWIEDAKLVESYFSTIVVNPDRKSDYRQHFLEPFVKEYKWDFGVSAAEDKK